MDALRAKIFSEENIYNAIYALESYVFERNLLSEDDINLFKQLEDKFNKELIGKIIIECQNRLHEIYTDNTLFDVSVCYKLKKVEDNGLFSFRPIHKASLKDQICMVCMLQPIMFDDTMERKPSELTKLIPHNFYGNIPSLDPKRIFVRWQLKYKEYSDAVLGHCKEYKDNNKYQSEVCLDLKDFFPSINPVFIFNYIYSKLKLVYVDSQETLKKTLVKLLYFHIDDSAKLWASEYYKCDQLDSFEKYMARGVAQGLPQSYYFGNIFMITAAEVIAKHFNGDAYYYVDDSVIYTNAIDEYSFAEKINQLNNDLAVAQKELGDEMIVKSYLTPADWNFQQRMKYNVKCHTNEKSYFSLINEAFDGAELSLLNRQISLFSSLSNNLSELDDSISLNKISEIVKVIDHELQKLSSSKVKENANGRAKKKMLQRNRRFFLFRQKQLQLKQAGQVSDEYMSLFMDKFMIQSQNKDMCQLSNVFDEEIFQTECRMLINLLNGSEAVNFKDNIVKFEEGLCNNSNVKYLYYKTDLEGALHFGTSTSVRYETLSKYYRSRFRLIAQSKRSVKQQIASLFLEKYNEEIQELLPNDYISLIKRTDEFNRCILNAFYSSIYDIDVSDEHHFIKRNNRILTYAEFRTLAYLRNTRFAFDKFKNDFLRRLSAQEEKLYGEMHIDMSLLNVLNPLILHVKDPDYVDNIILTHRLVSGLWKNGSKFLNAYTLHNEEHAISLIMQCLHIINVIDYLNIKQSDYYVLFLACYLHDISMVIPPDMDTFVTDKIYGNEIVTSNKNRLIDVLKSKKTDDIARSLLATFRDIDAYFEKKIRSVHPKDSAAFIRNHANSFLQYVTPSILDIVANVSESHGYDTDDVYKRASRAKSELYSLKYMMILLRLADLMDMSNDRINYFRLKENLNSMSEESQFHWISHLITDQAELTAEYNYDDGRSLSDEPIDENIKLKIYLNVAYKATMGKKHPCAECFASRIKKNGESEEISIKVLSTKKLKHSCNERCPIICFWMMCKNKYLVGELKELQRYLNSIHSRLFKTNIEICLVFTDKCKLDSELFDIVQQYLNKHCDD